MRKKEIYGKNEKKRKKSRVFFWKNGKIWKPNLFLGSKVVSAGF